MWAGSIWSRLLSRGVVVWLLLTVFGTVFYLSSADGLRPLSNAVQTFTLPGWVLVRAMGLVVRWNPGVAALVANTAGWGFWLIVARMVLVMRGRLVPRKAEGERIDLSRRRLMVDTPMALAGLGLGGGVLDATLNEPWKVAVRSYKVAVCDLPPSLDGLRLVQLSDTHLGPRIPAAYLRSVVARAVGMRPDVFVLTGDYIHNGTRFIEHAADLFRPLVETGLPVLGVLGNHDWYGDGVAMDQHLRRVGVRMIDNDRVFLNSGRRVTAVEEDAALCIAGLGDLGESVVRVQSALGRVPAGMPRVVLAHNPDTAEIADLVGEGSPRVDVMLCGHTHGGQVAIPFLGTPGIPSHYGQKYAGGLVEGPACRVIVSRGIGMSLVPVRIGVPPELVDVVLVRA